MSGTADDIDVGGSIAVGALVFAQTKVAFSAGDFAEFIRMAGIPIDEETADEFLSDLVDKATLRQIGPGVYAALTSG